MCERIHTLPDKIEAIVGEQIKLVAIKNVWPLPCIQWQVKLPNTKVWVNLKGENDPVLTFTANANQNGNKYRAIIQTKCKCLITNKTKVKIVCVKIIQQPQSVLFMNGENAVFTIAVSGNPAPTIQWQVSTNLGLSFTDLPGETSTQLVVLMDATTACNHYRAVVTNTCGTVISDEATISALLSALGGSTVGNLMVIDQNTAMLLRTFPSSIGFAVTGLAIDPTTGRLYGATSAQSPLSPNSLIEINRQTGAGTVIGPLGLEVTDISFESDGTLYGWTEPNDDLVVIDLTTGTAMIVADSGLNTSNPGLAFDPNDTLYLFATDNTTATPAVWTIDPLTGQPTFVNNIVLPAGVFPDSALASDLNGTLYTITRTAIPMNPPIRQLRILNLAIGFAELIGQVNVATDAIVFC
jgi:hypothetical protein